MRICLLLSRCDIFSPFLFIPLSNFRAARRFVIAKIARRSRNVRRVFATGMRVRFREWKTETKLFLFARFAFEPMPKEINRNYDARNDTMRILISMLSTVVQSRRCTTFHANGILSANDLQTRMIRRCNFSDDDLDANVEDILKLHSNSKISHRRRYGWKSRRGT